MKRCPQCSFLYLDSDQVCDLDQTPLLTDDFGTDSPAVEHSDKKARKPPRPAVPKAKKSPASKPGRKLTPKTLLAALVAGFIIGLMVLLTYQRMRPDSQASQRPTSQSYASQAPRVSQTALQALNEATKAELEHKESEIIVAPDGEPPTLTEPSASMAKTSSHARPDAARARISSNPVSTGDATKSGRGPVTIHLADGSTLEADEVWRTKAGIWYRRKGIVTFIKPNHVRTITR
jgi:hypothetical protein